MRSKLLRAIFPDREAVNLHDKASLHFPNAASNGSSVVAQAFNEVLPATSLISPSTSGNLLGAVGTPLASNGTEVFDTVAKNLDRLRAVTETQVTEMQANTSALTTNTAGKSVSQTASAASAATGGLFGGLAALPLVSGILRLFGGGSNNKPTQTPLLKYTAPPSILFDNTVQSAKGADIQDANYDQLGNPRIAASVPDYSSLLTMAKSTIGYGPGDSSSAAIMGSGVSNTQSSNPQLSTATQVTVNIQAMDSRSFLDRSQDIAQAVREAMLNMHSINDVVNDL